MKAVRHRSHTVVLRSRSKRPQKSSAQAMSVRGSTTNSLGSLTKLFIYGEAHHGALLVQRHAREHVFLRPQVVPGALRGGQREDEQPQVVQAAPQLDAHNGGPQQQRQEAQLLAARAGEVV